MNIDNFKHQEITEQIIKAFYTVYNTLGYGFLEKIYENSLYEELILMGLAVEKQQQIIVNYKEIEVGVYYADLVVEDCVILELKAATVISQEHEFQLLNYLKATDMEVGLLLNFGKKPEFKRKVFSNR